MALDSEGSTGQRATTKVQWSAATTAPDGAAAMACEEEGSRAMAAPWRRSRGRRHLGSSCSLGFEGAGALVGLGRPWLKPREAGPTGRVGPRGEGAGRGSYSASWALAPARAKARRT
jgi:hypothetical protein